MSRTGTLSVSEGVSRLSGKRLAIQGDADPFGAATNFLANRGLNDGDSITVDGSDGFVGNVPVIFMTDARAAAALTFAMRGVNAGKKLGKKGAKKSAAGAKKGAARAARSRKAAAKKSGGKKGGAKKASAGKKARGGRGGTKKSTGKSARKASRRG